MVNPAVVNQVAISYVKVRRGTSIQGVEMEETLNKRWPALFESDTLLPLLPRQYFDAIRRRHRFEGDKRLVLKLLEDGVDCFMKFIDSSTDRGRRLFRDAEDWINLEDQR